MTEERIYIFPSKEDFLKSIDEMIKFENNRQTNFLYLHKHLTSSEDVEREIRFIKHCEINMFQGYKTQSLIKVSLTSNQGERFALTYSFNISNSTPYLKLHRYLRKRERGVLSC